MLHINALRVMSLSFKSSESEVEVSRVLMSFMNVEVLAAGAAKVNGFENSNSPVDMHRRQCHFHKLP